LLASIQTSGRIIDVAYHDLLYVLEERPIVSGGHDYVLRTLDVTNPVSPIDRLEIPLPAEPRSISIGRSVVCVIFDADLLGIDISDPIAPLN
jgi:hypothetical protein